MSRRMRYLPVVAAVSFAATTPLPALASTSGSTSTVCVEVVVDYGALSPGRVNATCIVVPRDATGAQVLEARAKQLKVPPPRYRPDGLLCAIDGIPAAPACAEQTGNGGYKYWSYWHKQADDPWAYAQSGAFDYTVTGEHPGEGWSWVEGQEKNSRPPAHVSYSRVCPPAAPAPATHAATATSHGTPTHPTTRGDSASSHATARVTAAPAAVAPINPAGSTDPSTMPTPAPTTTDVTLTDPLRPRQSGGASLLGVVVGVALIVGLGGTAWWRARTSRVS